jgi:hypothetical protein
MYRRDWNKAVIASPRSRQRTALMALALLAKADGRIEATEDELLYAARAAGQALPEHMAALQGAVSSGWLEPIKSADGVSRTRLTLPEGVA